MSAAKCIHKAVFADHLVDPGSFNGQKRRGIARDLVRCVIVDILVADVQIAADNHRLSRGQELSTAFAECIQTLHLVLKSLLATASVRNVHIAQYKAVVIGEQNAALAVKQFLINTLPRLQGEPFAHERSNSRVAFFVTGARPKGLVAGHMHHVLGNLAKADLGLL